MALEKLWGRRYGPIGLALGERTTRLAQVSADGSRLSRSKLDVADHQGDDWLAEAIHSAEDARTFRGRDAVVCLGASDLCLQNLRVPKGSEEDVRSAVFTDAAGRLPYPAEEAEIRYVEAGDVRHADSVKREVIVMACHRQRLAERIQAAERLGLHPVAVDVEPGAIQRSFLAQCRRSDEQSKRTLLVHVGADSTAILVIRGEQALLAKYLDIGAVHFDDAVARDLEMPVDEAARLRRRTRQDRVNNESSELAAALAAAVRPLTEQLAREIALCIRYFSVTFRGSVIERFVLGGEESSAELAQQLQQRVGLTCERSHPVRQFDDNCSPDQQGQWDVAIGLALRQVHS